MNSHLVVPTILQLVCRYPLLLVLKIFCRFRIEGAHRFTGREGPYLFAADHYNQLDSFAIGLAIPLWWQRVPLLFVAGNKAFYADMFLGFLYGGRLFAAWGAFPILGKQSSLRERLDFFVHHLHMGYSLSIHPWGTRWLDPAKPKPRAHAGVVHLAQIARVSIVPVRIEGTRGLNPLRLFTFRHRITVTFGSPIDFTRPGEEGEPSPAIVGERLRYDAGSDPTRVERLGSNNQEVAERIMDIALSL